MAETTLQILYSLLQLFHHGVVLRRRLFDFLISILHLFLQIINLSFVHVTLVFLLENLVFFLLQKALDLLVKYTDLANIFLVQITHLLEHLRGDFRALLRMLLIPKSHQILQLVNFRLLLLNLTFVL